MYETREIDRTAAGIAQAHALLAHVFPKATHITPAYLDWQYNQNPAGAAVGFNAWSGDTLAAHYVTLPIRATLEGKPARGLLSLNTATHPEHQGKKLFTALAEATYSAAADRGFEFVVGVANANSTPGFTRKLGFQLVAPLNARVGMGPLPSPASDAAPQYEATWDAELVRWRLANPSRRYRLIRAGNRMRVEAPTGQLGIQAILADLPREQCPDGEGAGMVLNPGRVWIGIDSRLLWARTAYFELPRRLRPSPLNLIFRDLTGKSRTLDPARVAFRALDFDAY